jgi:Fe-S-cluster containining protein
MSQTERKEESGSEEEGQKRKNISDFESGGEIVFGDLWLNPNTGDEVTRCPWLRKLPKQDKYKCRIHDTKPAHCRNYPKSKRHALTTGCKGFGDDSTFDMVKRDLKREFREF